MLIADVALFHEVVATGSFSAVAKKKGLAPSTVSKAIERLEHKTSRLLFHRSTRALALTADGMDLLELTQQWIADADEMVQKIVAPPKMKTGLLRINMPVRGGLTKLNSPISDKVYSPSQ
jgi:DNA-binding transcriptional LysR family regulator